jgi:ABC-2 type transport system ATP-binding protein/lipopolysaccharide transport system ATP-binding protein
MIARGGDEFAVRLENIVVKYPIEKNPASSLKEYVIRLLKHDLQRSYLEALKGVSTVIRKGETFGIIGRNGAGKSTLLKVISRIIQPTDGRLKIKGKVDSLLGVGAGFHPELSGTENIFLYSAILGRPQALTRQLYNEIVRFSELGEFIDSPLRTYSTGMVARLGFAVAMVVRPDILLVDEVLGVGDEHFRQKCRERFTAFQEQGTTLIIVSHSLGEIKRLCRNSMWLHKGRVRSLGETDMVVDDYLMFKQADNALS